jgi:hypothetical protein
MPAPVWLRHAAAVWSRRRKQNQIIKKKQMPEPGWLRHSTAVWCTHALKNLDTCVAGRTHINIQAMRYRCAMYVEEGCGSMSSMRTHT